MVGLPTNEDNCTDQGTNNSLHPDFADRYDYPCNFEGCGGMGQTTFGWDDEYKKVDAGQTVQWTWQNPSNPSNSYKSKASCLFNLNNTVLNSSTTPQNIDDVRFSVKVNSSDWADFFHSRKAGHTMAPSVDLATHPILSTASGYDDHPNATNYLYLKVQSNDANVGLALCDGCNCNGSTSVCCGGNSSNDTGGRVDIYRVYQTVPVCDETTLTVTQSANGTITPTGDQNGVSTFMAYWTVTCSIVANEYYVVDYVVADGQQIDAAELEGTAGSKTYTFNSIVGDHTFTAHFAYVGCQACDTECYTYCNVGCQYCETYCETCETCQLPCIDVCDWWG
jgi:predicted ester cyclase